MKNFYIIILITMFCSYIIFGQKTKEYHGRSVILTDAQKIETPALFIQNDTVTYSNKASGLKSHLPLSNISEIRVFKGDESNTFLILGSLVGGGLGIAYALQNKSVEVSGNVEKTTIQTWPIYLGAFAVGAIGWLLGSQLDEWETVYENGRLKNQITISIIPDHYQKRMLLNLHMQL